MKRLFFKVFGLLLTGFLIIVVITAGLLWWVEDELRPRQQRLDAKTQLIAEELIAAWEKGDLNSATRQIRNKHHVRAWLLDENDQLLSRRPLPRRLREQVDSYPKLIWPHQNRDERSHILATEIRSGEKSYRVILQTGRRPFRDAESYRFILVPALVLILALIAATLLLSSWILRPLRIIRDTAGAISGNTPSEKIPNSVTQRNDAFGEVAVEFNRMTSRLQQNLDNQRQLVRDISHELRTPLARIQVAASLAVRDFGEAESFQRIESEVMRLNDMIESLLILSRVQHREAVEILPINIDALIESIVVDARFEFSSENKQIDVSIGHSRVIAGDSALLTYAIENIVRNALRFSPNAGTVNLSTIDKQSAVEILICDQGPGVEPELLERIFDPFFRADQARTKRDTDSPNQHGVGLAIAKEIVELHGGTISASNAVQGGLMVRIRLP